MEVVKNLFPDGNSPKAGSGTLKKLIPIAVGLILVLFLLSSSGYTVNDQQQAVVTTFGKVTAIEGAGFHFKLPYPVQKVAKIPVNQTQKLELGYRQNSQGMTEGVEEESKMITGDFNIVNIDFFIEWKISDPVKFLFASINPQSILKNSSLSAARAIVGSSTIDDVLTSGKIAIQGAIKERLIESMEFYDIGVQILDVKIQDSEPPNDDVKQAFQNVESAKQSKETAMNEANKYRNSELPKAQAEADKIMRDSESYKERRINEATGQVAKFQKMFEEYQNNKEITRTRMYLEAMEEILPGIDVYIDDGTGSIQKMLPLKPFNQVEKEEGR
jgi:modulator of FtsH protease HflK